MLRSAISFLSCPIKSSPQVKGLARAAPKLPLARSKTSRNVISQSASRFLRSSPVLRPGILDQRNIKPRYYGTKGQSVAAAVMAPYDKAEKCDQASSALISTLSAGSVDSIQALGSLQDFLREFHEPQSSTRLVGVMKVWTSKKVHLDLATRQAGVELAVHYYCEHQLLDKAETLFYLSRKEHGFKGSAAVYEALLMLAGRHRLRPSITLAFSSWKTDFGLSYSPLDVEDDDISLFQFVEGDDQAAQAQSTLQPDASPDNLKQTGLLQHEEEQEPAAPETSLAITAKHLFCVSIRAASRARAVDLAVAIFEESIRVIRNSIPLYETMVEAYCFLNRVESAYELLFEFEWNPTFRAIHTVLDACARLKNYHLSERTFYDIYSSWRLTPTADTWNLLLQVYINREDMQSAHNRFIDMLNSKEQTRPNAVTYETLIAGHVRAKDVQRASEMLRHALSNLPPPIPVILYAWVMEAHMYGKQYDDAFKIMEELRSKNLTLPNKFQNLLLTRCRRLPELLQRYEALFGSAPEPFDDLQEVRLHVQLKREVEQRRAEEQKNKVKAKKLATASQLSDSSSADIASQSMDPSFHASIMESSPMESVEVVENPESEYGILEEVIEDDAEVSKDEWMKDDIGEHGWKELVKQRMKQNVPRRKTPHQVNQRYADVFEAANWMNREDVAGAVEKKQWQILNDPFSRTRPEVEAKRKQVERSEAQIDAIERDFMERMDAQTYRAKLKEQRRRERAYGQTRRYVDDPKKKRNQVRDDRPPAGSTFSFR